MLKYFKRVNGHYNPIFIKLSFTNYLKCIFVKYYFMAKHEKRSNHINKNKNKYYFFRKSFVATGSNNLSPVHSNFNK